MHHIYHTEAFVLGSRAKGEDSKLLFLYTRELGLIYAHAQGVRKLSSKLRFTLQDLSRAQVDLVRGKEIWRVTTAVPVHSYAHLRRVRESERILARVATLLIRLVTGEEANAEVYDALARTYALLEVEGKSAEDYRALELLCVARILTALGYLSRATPGIVSEANQGETIPEEFSDIAYQHRLIRDINQALAASQL
jgi:DNA repair protein RecO